MRCHRQAQRDEWQLARQRAAVQRLAVITGTHPQNFPNIGSPQRAWGVVLGGTTLTPLALCRAAMLFACYRPGDISNRLIVHDGVRLRLPPVVPACRIYPCSSAVSLLRWFALFAVVDRCSLRTERNRRAPVISSTRVGSGLALVVDRPDWLTHAMAIYDRWRFRFGPAQRV